MIAGTYPKENNPLTSQDLDAGKSPRSCNDQYGCHSAIPLPMIRRWEIMIITISLVRSMLARRFPIINTYGIGYNQYVAHHVSCCKDFGQPAGPQR